MSANERKGILEEAIKITSENRNALYGEPEDNFWNIAKYWNDYLNQKKGVGIPIELQPYDVAVMMILMKISRIPQSPLQRDHWIDIAGYAACGFDCTITRVEVS